MVLSHRPPRSAYLPTADHGRMAVLLALGTAQNVSKPLGRPQPWAVRAKRRIPRSQPTAEIGPGPHFGCNIIGCQRDAYEQRNRQRPTDLSSKSIFLSGPFIALHLPVTSSHGMLMMRARPLSPGRPKAPVWTGPRNDLAELPPGHQAASSRVALLIRCRFLQLPRQAAA
jgi:hypothetical protein